jgi:hypothetical protein
MTETITEYVENEKIGFHFDAGAMQKEDINFFIQEGDNTRIRKTTSYRGTSYIDRCIFAFFKGTFKKIDQEYLDNFKKFAEGD